MMCFIPSDSWWPDGTQSIPFQFSYYPCLYIIVFSFSWLNSLYSVIVHHHLVYTSNTALMHPSFSGLFVTWAYLPERKRRREKKLQTKFKCYIWNQTGYFAAGCDTCNTNKAKNKKYLCCPPGPSLNCENPRFFFLIYDFFQFLQKNSGVKYV